MRRIITLAVLFSATAYADEFRVDFVRQSLTATYTHSQQFIDGIPVIGGERVERDGATIHERRARQGWSAAAHGGAVYLNVNGVARLARREVTGMTRRVANYYDANTGELLQSVPLFFDAAARVFDANPVVKLNDPTLQDHNNAASAVPLGAYATVELSGLATSGPLSGPNVRIVDTEAPFTTRAEASQSLIFDRSQPQFEEVNAYFHLDRSQRYLQSLGYFGPRHIVNYAIPVDAHAVDGADNSFYAAGDVPGIGSLVFGDGGTDDAEDSDIMIHEYGHAIHDSIAPGAFTGTAGSQARALAEGFGDYWAFSTKYAVAAASGRDPFCIGDWDARCWQDDPDQKCGYKPGADCLRRVDSTKTMADFRAVDTAGIEHDNGEIWSSALREIFLNVITRFGIEQGRRLADTIVIEGLFGTPVNPTFTGQAQKLLDADRALDGGANADVICRAMAERGILSCAPPRGESTLLQSTTSTIHVDDTRSILNVAVRVETDAAPGRVTLIAPDGTSILLTTSPQLDATYGLNAVSAQPLTTLLGRSAAGDWKLVVEGAHLRSWSLILQLDQPLTTRPTTTGIRKHIPVIGHVTGMAGTLFLTDVRIYNKSDSSASLLLIYGDAMMRVSVAPHQLMVLEDIVQSVFQTTGMGALEIQGDVDRVLVNSRTYTHANGGTYGETIPSFDTTDANADQIGPLFNNAAFRSNVGIAEIGGGSGVVRFTFFDAANQTLGSSDVTLSPYQQIQFRVPFAGATMRAQVSVVSGSIRFLAYGSVIDNGTGDATIIPADRIPQPNELVVIPSIHSEGVAGTVWRTEFYSLTALGYVTALPTFPFFTYFMNTNGGLITSRTYTISAQGTYGQFIPAIHAPAAATQEIIGIEESARSRTNVGMVNFGTTQVFAAVVVYDGAGTEVARRIVPINGRSLQQIPVATIVAGQTVVNGRIEVRGPVTAYASVVDNSTQDPSYIAGQY